MPLNHDKGEYLSDRDFIYRVVPVEKYQNLPRLTTVVEKTVGQQFKKQEHVIVPIWQAALEYAQCQFAEAGAPAGTLSYDVIAQEYPRENVVTFLFCALIKGEERYVIAPFQLTDDQIADLAAVGQWQKPTGEQTLAWREPEETPNPKTLH